MRLDRWFYLCYLRRLVLLTGTCKTLANRVPSHLRSLEKYRYSARNMDRMKSVGAADMHDDGIFHAKDFRSVSHWIALGLHGEEQDFLLRMGFCGTVIS